MSIPLKDFRLGIDERIEDALKAEATAFDTDMQSVARQVLRDWADRKHRAYTVYAQRLLANGTQPDLGGSETEDAGVSRIAPLKVRK